MATLEMFRRNLGFAGPELHVTLKRVTESLTCIAPAHAYSINIKSTYKRWKGIMNTRRHEIVLRYMKNLNFPE